MERPIFKVIQGDARPATSWLDFPATVAAPSPLDRTKRCLFRISKVDLEKARSVMRHQPAFELWSAILGMPPPVPNLAVHPENLVPGEGLSSLWEAEACFRGVRRPWAEFDQGENALAYVLKPRFLYGYRPHMVCVARKYEVPGNFVYVAHILLDEPAHAEPPATRGVYTHGGLVKADPDNPLLPIDHATRYTTRLW